MPYTEKQRRLAAINCLHPDKARTKIPRKTACEMMKAPLKKPKGKKK